MVDITVRIAVVLDREKARRGEECAVGWRVRKLRHAVAIETDFSGRILLDADICPSGVAHPEARRRHIHAEGGVPEWVPEGASIRVDLVGGSPQGRAWVDGVGDVAVNTLLASDGGFGTTYNENDLVPESGLASTSQPSLAGALLSAVLAGADVVVGLTTAGASYLKIEMWDSSAFNIGNIMFRVEPFGSGDPSQINQNALAGNQFSASSTNLVGVRIGSGSLSMSVSGAATETKSGFGQWVQLAAAYLSGDWSFLTSITVYDKNSIDLSAETAP